MRLWVFVQAKGSRRLQLKIIYSYIKKRSQSKREEFANAILNELRSLCQRLAPSSEDAFLLQEEVEYAIEAIKGAEDSTISRIMINLRDSIERFRLPTIIQESKKQVGATDSIKKLYRFVQKTSS